MYRIVHILSVEIQYERQERKSITYHNKPKHITSIERIYKTWHGNWHINCANLESYINVIWKMKILNEKIYKKKSFKRDYKC